MWLSNTIILQENAVFISYLVAASAVCILVKRCLGATMRLVVALDLEGK